MNWQSVLDYMQTFTRSVVESLRAAGNKCGSLARKARQQLKHSAKRLKQLVRENNG